jgi:tRNA (guanine9-N1)-methyltransferase
LKLNKIVETEDSIRIAIDLSYESLMIEKDIVKCSRQLLRCYTANRRAETPLPLYFTGMKLDTKFYAAMQKNDGFKNWDVQFREESFEHIFPKEKIVFLTSDSDNVIDKFEKGHVYVIGGLVDHNHNKGFCYEKARKLGVAHARLPLSENIDIKTRTVLTINHGESGQSKRMRLEEIILRRLSF